MTYVVKHSNASSCSISIKQSAKETLIKVHDNGIGIGRDVTNEWSSTTGHGLRGIKERLEFVNGSLDIYSKNGTTVNIRVPNVIKLETQEVE